MNNSLKEILIQAKKDGKTNRKFLLKLKNKKPAVLDNLFYEEHEKVFEKIDCLDCANCCKTTSPIFRQSDIKRIAKYKGMKPNNFISEYLKIDEDGDYVLTVAPCPFLEEDNKCEIYDMRPNACEEYPHTDRKGIHKILALTYENTLVCPAVASIVNEIKEGLTKV